MFTQSYSKYVQSQPENFQNKMIYTLALTFDEPSIVFAALANSGMLRECYEMLDYGTFTFY